MPELLGNLLHFPEPVSVPGSALVNEQTPLLPPDHAARTEALDIRASFIVEAPAGSGKTGLLMQRFLKLLAEADIEQPEEVLAITFTRKATAELRERILSQLRTASINEGGANADGATWAHAGAQGAPLTFEQTTLTLATAVLRRDAERKWGLLARPDRLHIRTIDSLCADIASTLPLLSGSAARRTPSENPEELYAVAAERTLLQLGGPDPVLDDALHTVLRHRDASLPDVRTLLARMLQQREQWGELVPLGAHLTDALLDSEVRPRLEAALESVVCAGLNRATRAIPPDTLQALGRLAARLAHQPSYIESEPSPLQICANRTEAPADRAEHLEHWIALISLLLTKEGTWRRSFAKNALGFLTDGAKPVLATLKTLVDELRDNESLRESLHGVRCLPPARYPEAQWHVAKALFRLLLRALAELKVLFAEREQCDFAELTLAAREALANPDSVSDLSRAAGFTLRHLLVDEMQDTSVSQYALIQQLSQSWDGHSQTVFLVGDPKQSIYLFRQARVERFLRAIREQKLAHLPVKPLYLKANFRSQATLVTAFKEDFGLTFPHVENSSQDVLFVAAQPIRPPSSVAAARVWHTCVQDESTHLIADPAEPDPGHSPDTVQELKHHEDEACAIRAVVESWRARPHPKGPDHRWSIAVLARAREHLSHVIRAFQKPDPGGATIPFTAVDIERLGERPEVLDLLALARALLHPADRVAWLAVLRAPWCGLALADLLALAGNGAPDSEYETLPATAAARRPLLTPSGKQLFDRTWPVLMQALASLGRSPLSSLVERTWRSLGGDAPLPARELANAQLFFTALRKAEEPGGRLDLNRFTVTVGKLFAEPQTSRDAVTLSTIHKAKGLEWDVVLVPGLERSVKANRSELLNWLELDNAGNDGAQVILAPIASKGYDNDKLYEWISSVRSAREAAERKRLFYVACTRAREELHLFAAATRKSTGLEAPRATLLFAAWNAAKPHFELDADSSSKVIDFKAKIGEAFSGEGGIRLVATADFVAGNSSTSSSGPPLIHRLPYSFSAAATLASHTRLSASGNSPGHDPGQQHTAFHRPEGSFAVRAFGNVVHRYLQMLAARLAAGVSALDLAGETASWGPRLQAAARAEGLQPAEAARLAERARQALATALSDPTGLWILSAHPGARSEATLRQTSDGMTRDIRIDRLFRAGAEPGSTGDSHLWIIDYKTATLGSRSDAAFAAAERETYGPQLATYARAVATQPGDDLAPTPVMLGLYYPLIPRLICWPATGMDHTADSSVRPSVLS